MKKRGRKGDGEMKFPPLIDPHPLPPAKCPFSILPSSALLLFSAHPSVCLYHQLFLGSSNANQFSASQSHRIPSPSMPPSIFIPSSVSVLQIILLSSMAYSIRHPGCPHPFTIEEQKAHIHDLPVGHHEFANASKARYSTNESVTGFVSSHGYPDGYESQKCSVELMTPPSSALVIHLSFLDLDVEPRYSRSAQCLRDYLVITVIDRDGREHTSERICSQEHPTPVRSMQPRARIWFIASSSPSPSSSTFPAHLGAPQNVVPRRGFRIKFEFVPEATILAPSSLYFDTDRRFISDCGGVNSPTDLSGEIRSPGFPFTYPRNVTCHWLLRVAPHRRLYLRLLDVELSPTMAECDRASLQFIDGYHHDVDGEEAVASLSHFQPKSSPMSSSDVRFCGGSSYLEEEGMKSFLSEGNRIIVRFTTMGSPLPEQHQNYRTNGTPIGFRLIWTEVESLVLTRGDDPRVSAGSSGGGDDSSLLHPAPFVSPDQCAGFVCRGGHFCMDVADAICVDRTRLCINATLRCDGVPNCAENDDSDEAYCYSQNVLQMGILMLLLLVIIATLACIFRYIVKRILRARKEMKREEARKEQREEDGGRIVEEEQAAKTEPQGRGKGKKRARERTIGWRQSDQSQQQTPTFMGNNGTNSLMMPERGGTMDTNGRRKDERMSEDHRYEDEGSGVEVKIATITDEAYPPNTRMDQLLIGNGNITIRETDDGDDLLPPCRCPYETDEEGNGNENVWERRISSNVIY